MTKRQIPLNLSLKYNVIYCKTVTALCPKHFELGQTQILLLIHKSVSIVGKERMTKVFNLINMTVTTHKCKRKSRLLFVTVSHFSTLALLAAFSSDAL